MTIIYANHTQLVVFINLQYIYYIRISYHYNYNLYLWFSYTLMRLCNLSFQPEDYFLIIVNGLGMILS